MKFLKSFQKCLALACLYPSCSMELLPRPRRGCDSTKYLALLGVEGRMYGQLGCVREGLKLRRAVSMPCLHCSWQWGLDQCRVVWQEVIIFGYHTVYQDGIQNLGQNRNQWVYKKSVKSPFQLWLMSAWGLPLTSVRVGSEMEKNERGTWEETLSDSGIWRR